jgi:uncharacterized membrane protein YphA (DoxX/SURF4 family)
MDGLRAFLRHPWTIRVSRLAIGAVFILAALPKIGDMGSFADQIHNYRMIPVASENLLAMILPWVELTIGLALILGVQARAGAILASALMVVFLIAIGQAVYRGLDIECGCFGTADGAEVGVKRLVEDVVFLALALVGSFRARL